MMVNDSSAVIVVDISSTTRVTGAPGVTVILSVVQITPKHAVMSCVPTNDGVYTPVELMVPSLESQTTSSETIPPSASFRICENCTGVSASVVEPDGEIDTECTSV